MHSIETLFSKTCQENNISSSTKVVVAVSGGVDSMVLLGLCLNYFQDGGIAVAHVNHNIRAGNKEEEIFIREYCEKKNIQYYSTVLEWGGNEKQSEEQFRKKRYDFLESIREKTSSKFLLTAHHANDLLETFLFRLSRGAGIYGLLSPKVLEGNLFRPLLSVFKNEIQAYAVKHSILWKEDPTNQDDIYARNKIRNQVIPVLQSIHPTAETNILQYIEDLRAYQLYIESEIIKFLEVTPFPLEIKVFKQMDSLFQKELLLFPLRRYNFIPSRGQLNEVLKIIETEVGGKEVSFGKCRYSIKDKKIYFSNAADFLPSKWSDSINFLDE